MEKKLDNYKLYLDVVCNYRVTDIKQCSSVKLSY